MSLSKRCLLSCALVSFLLALLSVSTFVTPADCRVAPPVQYGPVDGDADEFYALPDDDVRSAWTQSESATAAAGENEQRLEGAVKSAKAHNTEGRTLLTLLLSILALP